MMQIDREHRRDIVLRVIPFIGTLFLGLLLADLMILPIRGRLLPRDVPGAQSHLRGSESRLRSQEMANRERYGSILSRNIFNSDGVIPPAFGFDTNFDEDEAVPSQLPIKLVATVVHLNTQRSLAVFQVENNDKPQIHETGDKIENLAEVVRIRRGKVFLQAPGSRRLEYLEIPFDQDLPMGEFGTTSEDGVVREDETEFRIEKKTIQKHTANLAGILQQARAVPEIGANGQVEGFKVVDIQEGSIFEQLGIRKGDVIKGVNGERLDSVSKAIELYNRLRTESSIDVDIDRGGKTETLSYDIR